MTNEGTLTKRRSKLGYPQGLLAIASRALPLLLQGAYTVELDASTEYTLRSLNFDGPNSRIEFNEGAGLVFEFAQRAQDAPCATVDDITVTSVTPTIVAVAWLSSSATADRVEVEVRHAGNGTVVRTLEAAVTAGSLLLTDLDSRSSYEVAVVVISSNGDRVLEEVVTVATEEFGKQVVLATHVGHIKAWV